VKAGPCHLTPQVPIWQTNLIIIARVVLHPCLAPTTPPPLTYILCRWFNARLYGTVSLRLIDPQSNRYSQLASHSPDLLKDVSHIQFHFVAFSTETCVPQIWDHSKALNREASSSIFDATIVEQQDLLLSWLYYVYYIRGEWLHCHQIPYMAMNTLWTASPS